jgi:DNA processing protein
MNQENFNLLSLSFVNGIGAVTGAKLLRLFGSPSKVFSAEPHQLLAVSGVNKAMVRELKSDEPRIKAEAEIKICEQQGVNILFWGEPSYPSKLKQIYDPPLVLFCKGDINLFFEKSVAIVGTRRATNYGKQITDDFVKDLKTVQPIIVSGMAAGIDIAAHKAAINYGLKTFAVVAHGLSKAYPAEHKKYMRQVENGCGCLISELPYNMPADTAYFPRRNRIIAGLSDATVLVESNVKGGAMSTARLAAGYHRDVFAFPGRTSDVWSAGTNFLIGNNEAALISSAKDFCQKIGWRLRAEPKNPVQPSLFIELTEDEKEVRNIIAEEKKISFDKLYDRLNWPVSKLNSILLKLELDCVIKSLPGKFFELY